jgi:hypothetical protein
MDYLIIVVPLVISVVTSLPAIILAWATLVQVLRAREVTSEIRRDMNGRLNQLLVEQEARVRAEYAPARLPERAPGQLPADRPPNPGGTAFR